MKRKARIEWEFEIGIEEIWNVVTDLDNYEWRSDLTNLKKITSTEFIEYFKGGGETTFRIIDKIYGEKYSFDMKSKFFEGMWVGKFEVCGTKTKLIFVEEIDIKNPIIWLVSLFSLNFLNCNIKLAT
ncbi:hypothetical protein BW731_02210 [Vagococcus martis]|uniref:Polyketide cyclase n=1 Tax=Vagococcus martis TaxID=1768210 RepID=A0A1V4DFX9_9ENTE|nr:hypothetical protein [Vagococcus martis]OPF87100.1 hypothetical protein BW731_02210 [Vagococcus martis]